MNIILNKGPEVLPKKVLKSTQRLLQRMNQTTKRVEKNSGNNFVSNITAGIMVNGDLTLRDMSYFTLPVKKNTLMQGRGILALREPNVSISFDKKTGKVLAVEPHHMDTTTELPKVFDMMQKHLNQAERNFKKKSTVKKNVLNVEGLTHKAAQNVKEVIIYPDYSKLKTGSKPFLQRVCEKLYGFLMK